MPGKDGLALELRGDGGPDRDFATKIADQAFGIDCRAKTGSHLPDQRQGFGCLHRLKCDTLRVEQVVQPPSVLGPLPLIAQD